MDLLKKLEKLRIITFKYKDMDKEEKWYWAVLLINLLSFVLNAFLGSWMFLLGLIGVALMVLCLYKHAKMKS